MGFNILAAAGKTGNHPDGERIWKAFKKGYKSKGLLMGFTLAEIIRQRVQPENPGSL